MGRGLFACFKKQKPNNNSLTPDNTGAAESDQPSSKQTPPAAAAGPIVVELFSSQGCATSPEAELLFSRLGRGDFKVGGGGVILMGYHVDYWDYNGWKDPFGSAQWTVRQKDYVESLCLDTMFTPQVVVQGRKHIVGNDEDGLIAEIVNAPTFPPPSFQATFERPTPESLKVCLNGTLRAKSDAQGADIMVALYESGLVTDCQSGDNKGRMLANDFVVRNLTKLCSVTNQPPKKVITGTLDFGLWQGFSSSKCGLVVFVQQHGTRHVFGSQRIQLPANI